MDNLRGQLNKIQSKYQTLLKQNAEMKHKIMERENELQIENANLKQENMMLNEKNAEQSEELKHLRLELEQHQKVCVLFLHLLA